MKKLIIFSGLPVSGKSTLAEVLAQKLQIPILSVDPIESAILKSGFERNFATGLAAYVVAKQLAAEQLKLGMSIIIDAVNSVPETRSIWRELGKKYHAQLYIIECVLDENIHKKRVVNRVRNLYGIAEVTWEDVENRKKEYLPWQEKHVILDTKENLSELLEKALEYIQK